MSKRIIVQGNDFPIQPAHIHIGEGFSHFWDAFDNMETEVSAYYIIALCQEHGGWVPFTYEEIEERYRKAGHRNFTFNRLVEPGQKVLNAAAVFGGAMPQTEPIGGGWIVQGVDDKYYVTDEFVTRCFKSSPAHDFKTAALA